MSNITAVHGDITQQQVDAIVNAANNAMRGGGGVDGAIHRSGGPSVLRDCIERFPDGLATGDAGWPTAGELPARWVIHTVGPNYRAGQRDRALLTSCYRRALKSPTNSAHCPWHSRSSARASTVGHAWMPSPLRSRPSPAPQPAWKKSGSWRSIPRRITKCTSNSRRTTDDRAVNHVRVSRSLGEWSVRARRSPGCEG